MIYASDRRWWKEYANDLPDCEKWSADKWAATHYGLRFIRVIPGDGLSRKHNILHSGKNSGYQAINLAYILGAKNIFLVGYDMQKTGQLSHWHGDHPKGWSNSDGISRWVKAFDFIANDLQSEGVNVVNCTIETALNCFQRNTLKGAFNDL